MLIHSRRFGNQCSLLAGASSRPYPGRMCTKDVYRYDLSAKLGICQVITRPRTTLTKNGPKLNSNTIPVTILFLFESA